MQRRRVGTQETDAKKRHRLHALSLAARGHAQYRQDMAALLGVHRHSVAAWFDASAAGGVDQARRSQVSTPPVHRHLTAAALTALQDQRKDPQGLAGYNQIRLW